MWVSLVVRHLSETFRWSPREKSRIADVATAALGMGGPILFGAATGHIGAGVMATLGALAVGRIDTETSLASYLQRQAEALAPAVLAIMAVIVTGGRGALIEFLLIPMAVGAAALGGFSRPAAIATTRFILFVSIAQGITALPSGQKVAVPLLIVAGALWTSLLGLLFATLSPRSSTLPESEPAPSRPLTPRLRRWLRTLRTPEGWSYPARLGSGLLLGFIGNRIFPGHHLHWISVTIVLLTPRHIDKGLVQTTQRLLGTLCGVFLSVPLTHFITQQWSIALTIGALAGARVLFKPRNYLVYSAVMTPLIILIIDAGQPPDGGLLIDRVIATFVAGAYVAMVGWAMRLRHDSA